MKATILSLVLVCFSVTMFGQSSYFFPTEKGTVLTYRNYDAKGKVDKNKPWTTYTVNDVEKRGNATIVQFAINWEGKEKEAIPEEMKNAFDKAEVRIENGITYLDLLSSLISQLGMTMQSEMGGQGTVTFTGEAKRAFPEDLTVGMLMPESEPMKINMKISVAGMDMVMEFITRIYDEKVEATEELTTPGGAFPCFKISRNSETTQSMSIGQKKTSREKIVEWVSKGIGTVKSERYDEKGKLKGYAVLEKITR